MRRGSWNEPSEFELDVLWLLLQAPFSNRRIADIMGWRVERVRHWRERWAGLCPVP